MRSTCRECVNHATPRASARPSPLSTCSRPAARSICQTAERNTLRLPTSSRPSLQPVPRTPPSEKHQRGNTANHRLVRDFCGLHRFFHPSLCSRFTPLSSLASQPPTPTPALRLGVRLAVELQSSTTNARDTSGDRGGAPRCRQQASSTTFQVQVPGRGEDPRSRIVGNSSGGQEEGALNNNKFRAQDQKSLNEPPAPRFLSTSFLPIAEPHLPPSFLPG